MSQNTQESLVGTEPRKKFTTQFSLSELEKMAEYQLYLNNIEITDYNIGHVVHYILKAESIYNTDIGNLNSFILLYINYAIGHIRREKSKSKKEVSISVLEARTGQHFDTPDKPICSKESELFSHIKARKMLSPSQESVIYRLFFAGESEKDIAKSLNVTVQNINNIKKRALDKLRCLKSELL